MRIAPMLAATMVASLAFSPCGARAANATDDTNAQIMNHCLMIRRYAMDYSALRAAGEDRSAAWEEATNHLASRLDLVDASRLKAITGAYGVFLEALGPHRPETAGYYAAAHCLATHGQHKMLPVDSDAGITAINGVLARCEHDARDDDALGACILSGLQPLAK